jgi:hypothetical protein
LGRLDKSCRAKLRTRNPGPRRRAGRAPPGNYPRSYSLANRVVFALERNRRALLLAGAEAKAGVGARRAASRATLGRQRWSERQRAIREWADSAEPSNRSSSGRCSA